MLQDKKLETAVGFFLLFSIVALVVLALKVSTLGDYSVTRGYGITAVFSNVGDLKVRAPVTIAGVRVGEVSGVQIDPRTFKAIVALHINKNQTQLPVDSSASIYTQGLLGSNYISLRPGFDDRNFLKSGSEITNTHSALILEDLIGQLLFSLKNSDKDKSK